MNDKTPQVLTRREIAARWGNCSVRTVARAEKQFGLEPVTYIGLEPVFSLADVAKCEQRRMAHKRRTIAKLAATGAKALAKVAEAQIISVAEAKRRAGKGGSK